MPSTHRPACLAIPSSLNRPTAKRRLLRASLCSLLSLTLLGSAAHAAPPIPITSWELAGEFNDSTAVNPYWTYGYMVGTGPLQTSWAPFASTLCNKGFQKLPGTGLNTLPVILHNPQMTTCNTTISQAPRGLQLHPGINGESAVVRFTPSDAAQYRISGQFYALDPNGTQTSVSLKVNFGTGNPASLFSDNISFPTKQQASFSSKLVMLAPGQSIDFIVSAGPGNNFWNASTGLHAVIERAGPWCGPVNSNVPSSSTC